MATKQTTKGTQWMEDGDDAHFVPKRHAKKRIKTGLGASGRTGRYVKSSRKRAAKKVTARK